MRQINRLCPLHMSVSRDNHLLLALAQLHQRALQEPGLPQQFHELIPQPQAHVQRDLVVARAARMQFGPCRHAPRQGGFDVHVNVFQFRLPRELARFDFPPDSVQPPEDRPQLTLGQKSRLPQHRRVGH